MANRITVRLPPELLKRAKAKAAAEGRSLTSLIEEGLNSVVPTMPQSTKPARFMPPVSKASGGLVPGISLDRLSDLQENEDRVMSSERTGNGPT